MLAEKIWTLVVGPTMMMRRGPIRRVALGSRVAISKLLYL